MLHADGNEVNVGSSVRLTKDRCERVKTDTAATSIGVRACEEAIGYDEWMPKGLKEGWLHADGKKKTIDGII